MKHLNLAVWPILFIHYSCSVTTVDIYGPDPLDNYNQVLGRMDIFEIRDDSDRPKRIWVDYPDIIPCRDYVQKSNAIAPQETYPLLTPVIKKSKDNKVRIYVEVYPNTNFKDWNTKFLEKDYDAYHSSLKDYTKSGIDYTIAPKGLAHLMDDFNQCKENSAYQSFKGIILGRVVAELPRGSKSKIFLGGIPLEWQKRAIFSWETIELILAKSPHNNIRMLNALSIAWKKQKKSHLRGHIPVDELINVISKSYPNWATFTSPADIQLRTFNELPIGTNAPFSRVDALAQKFQGDRKKERGIYWIVETMSTHIKDPHNLRVLYRKMKKLPFFREEIATHFKKLFGQLMAY